MDETDGDLAHLQDLLDLGAEQAGGHLKEIVTPERRLTAAHVSGRPTGMRLLALATVTADGRPSVGPVDNRAGAAGTGAHEAGGGTFFRWSSASNRWRPMPPGRCDRLSSDRTRRSSKWPGPMPTTTGNGAAPSSPSLPTVRWWARFVSLLVVHPPLWASLEPERAGSGGSVGWPSARMCETGASERRCWHGRFAMWTSTEADWCGATLG